MSDYRFQITVHNTIPCLHVMIDGEPMAQTYIPLEDIQHAICLAEQRAEHMKKLSTTLKQVSSYDITLSEVVSVWNDVVESKQ